MKVRNMPGVEKKMASEVVNSGSGGESFVSRVSQWPRLTREYFEDLRAEMRRVTWPTWKQVRATTGVVIAAVFIFAAYFFVVDYLVGMGTQKLFDVLAKK